jgi:hypothetical protein
MLNPAPDFTFSQISLAPGKGGSSRGAPLIIKK